MVRIDNSRRINCHWVCTTFSAPIWEIHHRVARHQLAMTAIILPYIGITAVLTRILHASKAAACYMTISRPGASIIGEYAAFIRCFYLRFFIALPLLVLRLEQGRHHYWHLLYGSPITFSLLPGELEFGWPHLFFDAVGVYVWRLNRLAANWLII